ncbi:MAG TPA: hypothetical protein VMA13_06930, partial [Candidatus Saccharimonadales bacterium]|nr:hypothetical protein [Candidatus Saccharimonadales bacterium]
MNNSALLRSLIIFGMSVVLAVWLGYLLATPLSYSQLVIYGLVTLILVFPILLRWHYPLLLLSWNLTVVVFFLPGHPSLCLLMIAMSLGISVLQQLISRGGRFISVPQITLPLFGILVVIAFTAELTGWGLRSFGSEVYGGKKYVYLVGGILGYFALSAQQIPLQRKNLYLGLFFLGGITAFIGDIFPWLPKWTYFIYAAFTYNGYFYFSTNTLEGESARFTGAVGTSLAVIFYMLARYGFRGIFLAGKPWRWVILLIFPIYGLLGGFRGFVVMVGLTFAILFFLQGMHRTRLFPIFILTGFLGGLALIPLAPHLPYTFQRALAFLPLKIDPVARADAQESLDWRLQMWDALMPQVPQYLLLGKGYVISPLDYDFVMGPEASIHTAFAQNQGLALAEDFHNGPLSIIIPFGIWGAIVFLWFLFAGIRVLYANYRYGDPELQTANSFLL